MNLFCIPEFEVAYNKLIKKNSYKDFPELLCECFSDDEISKSQRGTLLNNSLELPFIKLRLSGRGGYRIYYYIFRIKDSIVLSFVHPKTGSFGSSNIDEKFKKQIMKQTIEAYKTNSLITLRFDHENKKLVFG